MPRIPEIGYQLRPTGPTQQPRMTAEAAGGGVGAALTQFGRAVGAAAGGIQAVQAEQERKAALQAEKLRAEQEKKDLWEAELQYLENENQVRTQFQAAKQAAPEGADGFAEGVAERFEEWMPTAMEAAPSSPAAQQKLQEKYLRLRNTLGQEAIAFEASSRASRDIRRVEVLQDGLANEVRADPTRLADVLEKGGDILAGAPFQNEQIRAEAAGDLQRKIYNAGLDGWVTQYETQPASPEQVSAAIQALKGGAFGFKSNVGTPEFDAALTRLENRKKTLGVESSALYGKDLADTLAAIEVNGPAADDGRVTTERALAVHKGDAEAARRDLQQIQSAKELYTVRQGLAGTSPTEDDATEAKLRAKVSGTGAAFEARNLDTFLRARAAKSRAYNTDHVAYLLDNNPWLAETMAKAEKTNDPELSQFVMDVLATGQEVMGTPYWRHEFMGAGAAAEVASRLNGMGAEDAANEVERLQQRYGTRWPQVARELEAAKVDPMILVLGRFDTVKTAVWRKEVAAAYQVGPAKLKAAIGSQAASDIDAEVDALMPEFNRTMAEAGRAGVEIAAREAQAIKVAAYHLAMKGDKSPTEAANSAYNASLGDLYDFSENYRTPKGLLGAVESAIGVKLSRLTPEMFAPAAAPGIAPEIRDTPELIEHRKWAAYSAATMLGKWANSPGGDGVILLRQDEQSSRGYSPARLANGDLIEIKFADLHEAGLLSRLGTPFPVVPE